MNDRELLGLAAKACGLKGAWVTDWRGDEGLGIDGDSQGVDIWNPLNYKADCLQMEIDLNFNIARDLDRNKWVIRGHIDEQYCLLAEHEDRQRASTMAAAQLGRVMG